MNLIIPVTDKEKKKEKKKKKKVTHIVSFDEDEDGSGKFSRINNPLSDRTGSFSYEPFEDNLSNTSSSTYMKTKTVNSNDASGAKKLDIDFKSIDQSESFLKAGMDQSEDIIQTGHLESAMNGQMAVEVSRDPSISSLRSDSRHSHHGSISSTDFELRYES